MSTTRRQVLSAASTGGNSVDFLRLDQKLALASSVQNPRATALRIPTEPRHGNAPLGYFPKATHTRQGRTIIC